MTPDSHSALKDDPNSAACAVKNFLADVAHLFSKKPFRPHRLFTGGHAQTLAAYAWPRRARYRALSDKERLFETSSNTKVLAHCRWQPQPTKHPTLVLWHGIEGSSSSVYMLAMASKGFSVGFNILRMNLRNCGATEYLTPTLYHGGLTEDLRAVVSELIERDGLRHIFPIGFSLGGNMVLKLAGEWGEQAPEEVTAVVAVSPSVDLTASAECIELRSNWIYERDFVRRLKKRIRIKHKMLPELYDVSHLNRIHNLRTFDDVYTSVAHGFENAADYYHRASSIRVMDKINLPTLIIHAEDDPFIPFAPLRNPVVTENPNILLVSTKRGGHVAFISDETENGDRFWSENRALEFCQLACERL